MSVEAKVSEPCINVYDVLGFDNPEMMQAKADIAHAISRIIRHRSLSQVKAAQMWDTTEAWVSAVVS